MRWLDAHLDLAHLALSGRDLTLPLDVVRQSDPGATITLPSLATGGVRWAFATLFTGRGYEGPGGYEDPDGARRSALDQLDVYRRLEEAGHLHLVGSAPDLDDDERLAVVLLMEGGDPIAGPEDVAWWREQGVLVFGLTWWTRSRYAGGNGEHGPLSPAGREVVAAIDEAGGVHDLSHLADDSAHELLDIARGPVVASHSNSRTLMDGENQRHLSDTLIAAVGERGGVVGLNLFSRFLVPEGTATVQQTVGHVLHAAEVMGRRDGVGLGSDADGGFGTDGLPEGIDAPADYVRIADALRSAGWSDREVEGFASGNWLALLRQTLAP